MGPIVLRGAGDLFAIAKAAYDEECEHDPPKNDDEFAGIVDWVMRNVPRGKAPAPETPTDPERFVHVSIGGWELLQRELHEPLRRCWPKRLGRQSHSRRSAPRSLIQVRR